MPIDLAEFGRLVADSIGLIYNPEYDGLTLNTDDLFHDPGILVDLGEAMAQPFQSAPPTIVVGPSASGYLLGPLVATAFGVGFVRIEKKPRPSADADRWRMRTTPPDYKDRNLSLGWRHGLIGAGDRVLFVDDLVDTGGQIVATHGIVDDIGASWVGASVIVDSLDKPRLRRDLNIQALTHVRDI
jgi:adenine phosphoribosyltransferase